MEENKFFKPTPVYKKYRILDLISKDEKITQRMMSEDLEVSVSMINHYLDEYEEKGYIIKEYLNSKVINYLLTKKGEEQKRLLNIWFLKDTLNIYYKAKINIVDFLNQIIKKGINKVLFYGAGEVAEIILQVLSSDNNIPLKVIAVIDDDLDKENSIIINTPIIKKEDIKNYDHDAMLISSYTHREKIIKNLEDINYDNKKIIRFFE